MAWRRLGLVYGPDGTLPWARSHAALPTAVHLEGAVWRVFFSARDADNRSSIGWADVRIGDAPQVLRASKEPVLTPGAAGSFDDSGAGIGCIIPADGRDRLYYMGWNLGVVAPWRNSIGVAEGDARRPAFARMFAGPIMDRSPEDPYTISYPCVLRLADGDWRMWYGSNRAWGAASSDMEHVIKHARSRDGLHWDRSAGPALDFSAPGEYAMARPWVLFEDGVFRMWFATRGAAYRIGAAISKDGVSWRRCDDEYGLTGSGSGWDANAVSYPFAFRQDGSLYLLYNGDAYGRDGFGLAVWD